VKRHSTSSRIAAGLAAFLLAFAQLAMAAFAPTAATPKMAESMAAGAPCHGVEADPGAAQLCFKKNCQQDAQKHDKPSLDPAALPRQEALRVDPPCDPDLGCGDRRSLLVRATSPPPLLAFSRRLE